MHQSEATIAALDERELRPIQLVRARWIHKVATVTPGAAKTTYLPKWIIPAFIVLVGPRATQQHDYDTRRVQALLREFSMVSITFTSHALGPSRSPTSATNSCPRPTT